MLKVAAECHLKGLVHRDMKPQNFLFKSPKEDSPDLGLSDFISPVAFASSVDTFLFPFANKQVEEALQAGDEEIDFQGLLSTGSFGASLCFRASTWEAQVSSSCTNQSNCVLSADVFARFCRLRGYNVLYVCGTDEYGTATETKAVEEGLTPKEICEKYHAIHKDIYKWFNISFDEFGRTSTPQQTEICQAIFTKLFENRWISENTMQQFMGKDNVPFHTVMFPSTLLGTGEKWTLVKSISVTEYLNYESGKFSKSKGVGVFGNDAKDTKIPAEVWRYYLLTNRPEVSDTLFTWKDLQAKLNSELLNNLGNFVNRVLSFIAKPNGRGYGSIVPDAPGAETHCLTKTLAEKVGKYVEQYLEDMEKIKLKQGLKTGMRISSEGNAYLQNTEFWKLYKEDEASCAIVIRTSVGLVYLIACLLEPFMPSFTMEVPTNYQIFL
ncbi:hypothetical protein POM88_038370 [Heracleum sosnowskyi]|uniref:methionine--tRNA ligase n=1 Tax=Heracleum sosnowskyi TaxID=360622 RepID=A0AAD8M7R4_9APIA|nr:hypothetical protein POM88_038370 [Heracleum sosnowskyi]